MHTGFQSPGFPPLGVLLQSILRPQRFLYPGGGHLRVSADRTSATAVSGPFPRSGTHPSLHCQLHVWLTFLPFQTSGVLILFSPSVCPSHPPTLSCGRNSLPFPASRHPSGEAASSPHLCLRHHQGPLLPTTSLRCESPRIQAATSPGPLCLLLILFQGPLPSLSFLCPQTISMPSCTPSPACISE